MNILIIPGLHRPGFETIQRHTYETAAKLWSHEGHIVNVQQFGWYTEQTLGERRMAINKTIDTMPEDLYVIGASAGGLAAIGALRDNPVKVKKVLTIATPLQLSEAEIGELKNKVFIPPLFEAAYKTADSYLNELGELATGGIVTLYGQKDARILPEWSRRRFIPGQELPTHTHGSTILGALTLYRKQTQRMLAD